MMHWCHGGRGGCADRDEHHVSPCHRPLHSGPALFRGVHPDLRVAPGAQPSSEGLSDLQTALGRHRGHGHGLDVGVHHVELHPAHVLLQGGSGRRTEPSYHGGNPRTAEELLIVTRDGCHRFGRPTSTMRLTAFEPPPPTPMTLMTAPRGTSIPRLEMARSTALSEAAYTLGADSLLERVPAAPLAPADLVGPWNLVLLPSTLPVFRMELELVGWRTEAGLKGCRRNHSKQRVPLRERMGNWAGKGCDCCRGVTTVNVCCILIETTAISTKQRQLSSTCCLVASRAIFSPHLPTTEANNFCQCT